MKGERELKRRKNTDKKYLEHTQKCTDFSENNDCIVNDVLGSYTGNPYCPKAGKEKVTAQDLEPVQDVDDL